MSDNIVNFVYRTYFLIAYLFSSLQRVPRAKKTSVPSLEGNYSNSVTSSKEFDLFLMKNRRKMSDPDIHHSSTMFSNISESESSNSLSHDTPTQSQSIATPIKQKRLSRAVPTPSIIRGRALINPFDPSHVTIKMTSNRRRWSHIFPKVKTSK